MDSPYVGSYSVLVSDKPIPADVYNQAKNYSNPRVLDQLWQSGQFLSVRCSQTVIDNNIVIYKQEYAQGAEGWQGYYHLTKDGLRHGITYHKHIDGREDYYIYILGYQVEHRKIKGDIKWVTKFGEINCTNLQIYLKNRLVYSEWVKAFRRYDIQVFDKINFTLLAEYHNDSDNNDNDNFIIYNVDKDMFNNIVVQLGEYAIIDYSSSLSQGNIVNGQLHKKNHAIDFDRKKVIDFIKSLNPLKDEKFE